MGALADEGKASSWSLDAPVANGQMEERIKTMPNIRTPKDGRSGVLVPGSHKMLEYQQNYISNAEVTIAIPSLMAIIIHLVYCLPICCLYIFCVFQDVGFIRYLSTTNPSTRTVDCSHINLSFRPTNVKVNVYKISVKTDCSLEVQNELVESYG